MRQQVLVHAGNQDRAAPPQRLCLSSDHDLEFPHILRLQRCAQACLQQQEADGRSQTSETKRRQTIRLNMARHDATSSASSQPALRSNPVVPNFCGSQVEKEPNYLWFSHKSPAQRNRELSTWNRELIQPDQCSSCRMTVGREPTRQSPIFHASRRRRCIDYPAFGRPESCG